jgi:hypothetical protein
VDNAKEGGKRRVEGVKVRVEDIVEKKSSYEGVLNVDIGVVIVDAATGRLEVGCRGVLTRDEPRRPGPAPLGLR